MIKKWIHDRDESLRIYVILFFLYFLNKQTMIFFYCSKLERCVKWMGFKSFYKVTFCLSNVNTFISGSTLYLIVINISQIKTRQMKKSK